MEEALQHSYRAVAIHRLGPRSWRRAYPAKEVAAAQRVIDEDREGSQVAARQTVKVGKFLDYISKDPKGADFLKALLLQRPLQRTLNTVFKAQALTSKFTNAASLADPSRRAEEGVQGLRDQAARANLRFISGQMGRAAIAQYHAIILDFDHEGWNGLAHPADGHVCFTRAERFTLSLTMLAACGIAYRRLLFVCEQPKLQLLTACGPDASHDACGNLTARLHEDMLTCSQCVDAFTKRG